MKKTNTPFIDQLIEQANQNKVAILREQTLAKLLTVINEQKVIKILEIGSGIGYSAYMINQFSDHQVEIISIEKDPQRFLLAQTNLVKFSNIKLINADCFCYKPTSKFNLIILDGPKKNQIDLIYQFKDHLEENGIIFIDNLFLLKFQNQTNLTKHQQKIIKSIKELNEWIDHQKEFIVERYNLDDGFVFLKK